MRLSQIFNVTIMCFNPIHENKILTKISEITVSSPFAVADPEGVREFAPFLNILCK